MIAWVIARHQLYRVLRSPVLILLLAAIPLTLAVIEYAAFGPTVASGRLPAIKVLIIDEDGTLLSQAVPQLFAAGGPMKDMFETSSVPDRATARNMFQRNQASALVVVPKGFQRALLAGEAARVEFAPNPLQTFSPEIVRSVLDMTMFIGNSLYRQAADPIRRINALQASGMDPTAEDIAEISRGFFEAGRRLTNLRLIGNVDLPVIRPTGDRDTTRGPSPQEFFAFTLPGLAVFGIMFISQALALRLMRDRMQGLDRRVGITPVTPVARYLGSLLFMMVAIVTLFALIMLFGAAVFGIELRHPVALAAIAVGFALFAAALNLTIIAVAKDERSASFVATPVIMVLSLLGGSFVPGESYPPFLRALAFMTPNGSAQQGFIDVLAHAQTFAQITGRLLTAWGWAIAMTIVAVAATRGHSRS